MLQIPTTRARSPKLGRHKPSTTAAANCSEGSLSSPRVDPVKSNSDGSSANVNGGSVAVKKPTQKLLTKVPSQKSTAAKPEAKPLNSKPKVSDQKQKTSKPKAEGNNKKSKDGDTLTEISAKRDATDGNEINTNSADPEVAKSELVEVPSEVPEASIEVTVVPVKD